MPFTFKALDLVEAVMIRPDKFSDQRGTFTKLFNLDEFSINGIDYTFLEDSISVSKKDVLRGMHYQLGPHVEGKLVIILSGKVFDAIIDMRRGSPNFGKSASVILSGENNDMLWVPPGFAHGFVSLEDNTQTLYKMTEHYLPDKQKGVIWNDPKVNINWPVKNPILSQRDAKLPTIDNAELNFDYKSIVPNSKL